MRCYRSDSVYFDFLDGLCDGGVVDQVLVVAMLVEEFRGLRSDEARAVFADWRAACRSGYMGTLGSAQV